MSGQKKKTQQPVLHTTQDFRSYTPTEMGDLFLSPTGIPTPYPPDRSSSFVPSSTVSISISTPVASGGAAKPPARTTKTTKPSKTKKGGAKKK